MTTPTLEPVIFGERPLRIDDVLALTRNGYLGDTDEPFLPSKLIDDIVSEIVPLALERGNTISVVVQGNAKQSLINSKSRSFQLTVRNLVSNAVKYTSNGEIEVTLTAQTVAAGLIAVEVAIKDTGIGIRPVDQSRIFEEFAMVGDSPAGKVSGFGLGLSIAKSSVERLQGRIGVESELGKAPWFAGDLFSAADIQMSFPVEAAAVRAGLEAYPNLVGFLQRIHARPAYQRALEQGGPFDLLG